MKATLAGLALLCAGTSARAEDQELRIPEVTYPEIVPSAYTVFDFIPEGWVLEKKAEGDLNRDGRDDVAGVLRMRDSANIVDNPFLGDDRFDTNPRILLVAFRQADGQYHRVLADHTLIPRRDNPSMEDHFDGIVIERGALKIEMHVFMSAGGWSTFSVIYTFRWQEPGFLMIGYDRKELARNTGIGEDISINYVTRRRKIISWRIEDDRQTIGWKVEPSRPLRSLAEIGDGLQFSPDQE